MGLNHNRRISYQQRCREGVNEYMDMVSAEDARLIRERYESAVMHDIHHKSLLEEITIQIWNERHIAAEEFKALWKKM